MKLNVHQKELKKYGRFCTAKSTRSTDKLMHLGKFEGTTGLRYIKVICHVCSLCFRKLKTYLVFDVHFFQSADDSKINKHMSFIYNDPLSYTV